MMAFRGETTALLPLAMPGLHRVLINVIERPRLSDLLTHDGLGEAFESLLVHRLEPATDGLLGKPDLDCDVRLEEPPSPQAPDLVVQGREFLPGVFTGVKSHSYPPEDHRRAQTTGLDPGRNG